jgi:hypothetical protein
MRQLHPEAVDELRVDCLSLRGPYGRQLGRFRVVIDVEVRRAQHLPVEVRVLDLISAVVEVTLCDRLAEGGQEKRRQGQYAEAWNHPFAGQGLKIGVPFARWRSFLRRKELRGQVFRQESLEPLDRLYRCGIDALL